MFTITHAQTCPQPQTQTNTQTHTHTYTHKHTHAHTRARACLNAFTLECNSLLPPPCLICLKVAEKLKRLVNVMAVDVEQNNAVARELENRYNFKLQGAPHIFFLKPQANGKQKRIFFDSDRSYSVLYKAALAQMPGVCACVCMCACV